MSVSRRWMSWMTARRSSSLRRRAGSLEEGNFARLDHPSTAPQGSIEGALHVHELHARALTLPVFPGYKQVYVSLPELRALVKASEQSWRGTRSISAAARRTHGAGQPPGPHR